jgi:hypothetical protein
MHFLYVTSKPFVSSNPAELLNYRNINCNEKLFEVKNTRRVKTQYCTEEAIPNSMHVNVQRQLTDALTGHLQKRVLQIIVLALTYCQLKQHMKPNMALHYVTLQQLILCAA